MRATDIAARTGVRRKHRLEGVEKVRPAVEAPHGKPREHSHDCGHKCCLVSCPRDRGQAARKHGVTRDCTFSSTHRPSRKDAATSAVTRFTSVALGVPGMRNHTVLGAAGWPAIGGTEPRVSTSTQLRNRRRCACHCSGLAQRAAQHSQGRDDIGPRNGERYRNWRRNEARTRVWEMEQVAHPRLDTLYVETAVVNESNPLLQT